MRFVLAPLSSGTSGPLSGRLRVPGDKSISHRAVMLSALAIGKSRLHGLLEGEDVLCTAAAMKALGARVERRGAGEWEVEGVGLGGLVEPDNFIDLGNSGTSARLLSGILAGHPLTAFLTGDASLRKRPMSRVAEPLARMGARFVAREGLRLPLAVIGSKEPIPITYELPVPSAQVKSAVLLAGLNAPGRTTVIEREPTRDHSELMLRHFGADVEVAEQENGSLAVTIHGQPELRAAGSLVVPGDPSSAAFPVVAALLLPGSDLTIEGVGLNSYRIGLFETLVDMGAGIEILGHRLAGAEPVADLRIRSRALKGVEVPAARAPSMIDEYPILAVAAAFASGRTVMRGLSELRVKESDRLTAIAEGLAACGVEAAIEGDDLIVEGKGEPPEGGAEVNARLDHRIAMSFLVMGMAARRPVRIDDAETINTSFPGFVGLMNGLGAAIA